MNSKQNPMSEEELKMYFELSGHALRLLHDGDYESAIKLYEKLTNKMAFLPNYLYLSRSYVQAGRISDAIRTLEAALELQPDAEEVSKELRSLRERAYELLIKYAVFKIQGGEGASWCKRFLDENSDLANSNLFEILSANAIHNAQIPNSRIVSALVIIVKVLSDKLREPAIQACATELEGIDAYVSGDYKQAFNLLRRARELISETCEREKLVSCLNHLGMAATRVGSYAEAVAAYNEAITYYDSVNNKLQTTRTLENLANLYLQQSDHANALKLASQIEEGYAELGDKRMSVKAMSLRGKCLAAMRQLREALHVLEEAVDRGRAVWLNDPIFLGDTLLSKSYVLADMNRLKESQEAQREAEEIYRVAELTLPDRTTDGTMEAKLNDFEESVKVTCRKIQEFEQSGMLVDAAREKMNLSYLYTNQLVTITSTGFDPERDDILRVGMLMPESRRLIEEAISVFTEHNAIGYLIRARKHRAIMMIAEAKMTKNEKQVENALEELDTLLGLVQGSDEKGVLSSLTQNKAQILIDLGRLDEAGECLEQFDLDELGAGDDDVLLYTCQTLARLYIKKGDIIAAKRMFLRAVDFYESIEDRVGDPELTVSWSKGEAKAFDESIDFFMDQGEASTAYELVQRAKARIYQKALSAREHNSD